MWEDSLSALNGGGSTILVNGEVVAAITGYIDDFSEGLDQVRLGDIFPLNSIFPQGFLLPKELST
jgi:hypothetical protein